MLLKLDILFRPLHHSTPNFNQGSSLLHSRRPKHFGHFFSNNNVVPSVNTVKAIVITTYSQNWESTTKCVRVSGAFVSWCDWTKFEQKIV
jgi:hypothetical protein